MWIWFSKYAVGAPISLRERASTRRASARLRASGFSQISPLEPRAGRDGFAISSIRYTRGSWG